MLGRGAERPGAVGSAHGGGAVDRLPEAVPFDAAQGAEDARAGQIQPHAARASALGDGLEDQRVFRAGAAAAPKTATTLAF